MLELYIEALCHRLLAICLAILIGIFIGFISGYFCGKTQGEIETTKYWKDRI